MSDWEDDDAPQSTTIPVNGFSSNNNTNFGSSKGTGFGRGRGFAIDNNESGSRFGSGGGGRGFGGSESDVPRGGGFRSSNRGGGFGSRGGGGGGGRSCYKCGEDGHMSRDCPQGGGGDRKKGCFKCGEEGHMSRDCPSGGGGGFGSSNGGFGSSNSGGGFGSSSGGGFGSSGGGGFKSSSSGGFGGPGGERKKGCFKCGEDGHMSRDCPNSDGGGASGDRKKGCFKCGEDGHMSRDCPSAGDGDDNRKKGCFNCGEEGHFSKECTNPAQPRTGADGKLREIYVPPDLDEDENVLFHDGITSGINFSKYDHINVSVSGNDIVSHINSFESSNLREILKENVKKCNYLRPTPIQKHALPIIMAGRDVMACAQTGSGKTAAFLLPIIHKLLEMDAESGAYQPTQEPLAVIISPTRELAIQIYQESCKFASRSMIKCVVAYGGTSVMHQTNKLKNGCHILVATPGRLLDFVEKGKVSFSRVQFLVLDEADRMLDMGFMPEIQRMVKNPDMPKKGDRQTLMFSATFPAEIQRLAADFLHDYLFVVVGMVGAASSDVSQSFVQVDKFGKRDRLMEVLGDIGQDQKTLVFVETKRTADFIATYLSQKQLPSTSIHGDRLQREREEALRDFKQGRMPILIATSVAARGLDIRGVSYVVNYDLPKSVDEYVHRIGRTGRVGNIGNAISFYDSSTDTSLAKDLVKILADAQQEVPDFLSQDASQSGYTQTYQGSGNFSSRDARKGQFNGGSSSGGFTSQPTSALEADDEWD